MMFHLRETSTAAEPPDCGGTTITHNTSTSVPIRGDKRNHSPSAEYLGRVSHHHVYK